ncbi:MAG: hypothetical protein R2697_05775 [Ilumatobacteraceae bacterium]
MFATWSPRRWLAAAAGAAVTALLIGLPTDLIPNPVFGRQIEAEWWSMPVLVVTSVLAGLLFAPTSATTRRCPTRSTTNSTDRRRRVVSAV